MGLVGKGISAARSVGGMVVSLSRATHRPAMAANYAIRALTDREHPVALEWQGLQLQARGIDWPALQEVLVEDEYGAMRPYLAAARPPIVLDIGANIGTFAMFSMSIAPSAVVHSFEPSLQTFTILDSNRKLNPALAWHAHHAAGWREDGTVRFASGAASTAGRVSDNGTEAAPALSLASILALAGGTADIAKIDIEGAEEALLVDRQEELARIDTIVVELHPGRCATDRVVSALRASHGELYAIQGRRSSKPLLLATRSQARPSLPLFLK